MEKKKALLVVAGGRGVPDRLPLLYLQPDLVLSITSMEGWEGEIPFFDAANGLSNTEVKPLVNVDAYDLDVCMQTCREICNPYPDTEWEWTFTITSAPKILAIAAYEVAKERKIPCWYCGTQDDKFVSLVKEVAVDKKKFFHLSFIDYVKAQGRRYREKPGPTRDYRKLVLGWEDIAQEMATSQDTTSLTPFLFTAKKQADKSNIENVPIQLEGLHKSPLLQLLVDRKLLYRKDAYNYHFMSKVVS